MIPDIINPFDADALRSKVLAAKPFPFFAIDNFLRADFAEEALAAFPTFEQAVGMGKQFVAVNEKRKVQITDSGKFSPPILRLHEALSSQGWLDTMSHVMSIPRLLADEQLIGGGIHETGPRGRLDVHVDFNYIESRQLHRRLNILVYFNKGWKPEWGGEIELWDVDVKKRWHAFTPIFNRCVVFETNEISFHGVSAVQCPEDRARKSFAAYYYTKEAPAHWTGQHHSTIFRARPDEKLKGMVLMPAEKMMRSVRKGVAEVRRKIKGR